MLKFIHGADFHLDSAFGALPPRQAAGRRRESRELPFRLANLVHSRGCQVGRRAGEGRRGSRRWGRSVSGRTGRGFSCIHGRCRRHDNLLAKKHIPAFVDRLH